MRTSYELIKVQNFYLTIDEQSTEFKLTLGTSSTSKVTPRVNIELPSLTITQLSVLAFNLMEVIAFYHPSPPDLINEILRKIPGYKPKC